MSLPLSPEQLAQEKAARLAQFLQMGRTMVAIQDGCSFEVVRTTAFEEYMTIHSRCPCCRGSSEKAKEITDLIMAVLNS